MAYDFSDFSKFHGTSLRPIALETGRAAGLRSGATLAVSCWLSGVARSSAPYWPLRTEEREKQLVDPVADIFKASLIVAVQATKCPRARCFQSGA